MTARIIVVGGALLPADVEFPPLDKAKNAWEEYPSLTREGVLDRCWRADVLVVLSGDTGIERTMLPALPRLKLLTGVAEGCGHMDRDALLHQDIELREFSGEPSGEESVAQDLCNRIARAIDDYLLTVDGVGQIP